MRKLLILVAVAAVSAACHNRSEDETGATPDRGNATVTASDTMSIRTDSTIGQRPGATDTSEVRQDTTSMGAPMPTQGDSAMVNQAVPDSSTMGAMSDSSGMGHDNTTVQGDSAMINRAVPDSTARK
jgi:hypothetical protein